jgi:hypothetical protein
MVKHTLTVALVNSILHVLDRLGPTVARRRRRRPRCRGPRRRRHHRTVPEGTLDLDWLHRTGGDPGTGPSRPTPEQIPNPRVRVTPRPPSPLPCTIGLLADGTLRSGRLSVGLPGTALCHPWHGLVPIPGCTKATCIYITG